MPKCAFGALAKPIHLIVAFNRNWELSAMHNYGVLDARAMINQRRRCKYARPTGPIVVAQSQALAARDMLAISSVCLSRERSQLAPGCANGKARNGNYTATHVAGR